MAKQKNPENVILKRRQAKEAEALLRLMANTNRLLVLCQMAEGERTVGELAKSVDLSSSALSQHLAKLRIAGLVTYEKRGKKVYYRLASVEVQALMSVLHLMYCKN